MQARRLVGAVLAPHDRKYAKFDKVGLAAQPCKDALVFFRAQPVLLDDLWGDFRSYSGHKRPLSGVGQAWKERLAYACGLSPPKRQSELQVQMPARLDHRGAVLRLQAQARTS